MRQTGVWRMNITLLDEPSFRDTIKELWSKWKRNASFYPNRVVWWDRNVKRVIRQAFQREGAMRNRDRKDLENFYYDVIYQAIRDPPKEENTALVIRRMKAKLLRLHSMQRRGVLLDTAEKDRTLGEEVTIHQFIQSRKRRKARRSHM